VGDPLLGDPLLAVEGVCFSYGPLQVLFDVDLTVPAGGRVGLLGTNGAGKSTLLRVVAGLGRPTAGSVRFDGRDITDLPTEDRVALGMTLLEGGRATFPSLTVAESLRIGAYPYLTDRSQVERSIGEALELFPALGPRLGQRAGTLSGGEQQMLALAKALLARPRLLMIDELSLGLAPVVLEEIIGALDVLVRERDVTLVLVEQSLNVALGVTDEAYFMEKGTVRFSGATAELLDRGDLVRSVFFGTG
jgi:ABC-type branched-subunit amino acid transport system ATPase component